MTFPISILRRIILLKRSINDFSRRVRATLRDVKQIVLYDLLRFIKRVYDYLPILWRDRDWDYHHLLALIEYKLSRMQKVQETCLYRSVEFERHAKNIKICRLLLKTAYGRRLFTHKAGG